MSGMFNMDIDAFFKAQDLRMNEPEDGVDEILARSAQARGFPDPFNVFSMTCPNSQAIRAIHPFRGILAPSSSIRDKRVAVDDAPMYPAPVSPMHGTPPRGHASTSIRISPPPSMPQIAPDDNPPILKRKESPTKPDKPARKKAAIDAGLVPPSLKTASNHPPSKKFKSLDKLVPPPVKISPAPVPEVIDLSTLSPIEEPDFSVLVSRFEPAATSTQPMVAAAPSMFSEIKERVEKHAKMKRDKKLLRGASNTGSKVAGPSKARPSDISGDESSIIASSSRPSSPEPIRKPALGKSSAKPKPKPQPAAQAKLGPAKKGKKEKIKMLPHQFAQMLIDESKVPPDPAAQPKRKVHQFLKGKNIFYTGGDMTWASEKTMACMRLIMKHGGTLFPRFDSSLVTHVISEASRLPTLRALGIQKMKELPEHIPIVTWKWVVSGIDSGEPGELWEYAAFSERMPPLDLPARNPNAKGKQRAVADASADLSRISSFTQDKKQREKSIHDSDDEDDEPAQQPAHYDPLPSPPSSPRNNQAASSSRVKIESSDDPLAEFYAQARADRDAAFARHGEAEEQDETDVEDAAVASDSDNEQKFTGPPPKRGWTADSKEAQRKNGPNEDIAKKLEELMLLHKAKPGMDDHWRAFSYQKCLRALRNYPKRIKTFNEARSIRGVGDKTALKIMEIIETGDLRRIGYENTADVQIRKVFQGIYGVGQTTAYKWYAAGCRSLDDLKAGKGGVTLTDAQKIGIEFYDDINDRMPREEAAALFDIIKPIALGIDPKLEIQIMGSFRRGKADCGDIDIMITRCPFDGKTHTGILHDLLKALHEAKIITEDLALPENPLDEEAIYRGLCHLPQAGSRRRRIDFLTVPWKSRGAALLYYTGDDIFNRAMRYKANRLGYSLNQKGLFAGVVRDPRNWSVKTNTGNIVASETEEEIFHMLGCRSSSRMNGLEARFFGFKVGSQKFIYSSNVCMYVCTPWTFVVPFAM
ncbi:DNA polymerase lambda [Mycena sanguinolenta]|uniref:DNA polymerase lambda n=1 Tax=Mycena sanguinolenta TaxID=230812 RepID=A0A8H6ZDF6_9AGAR|nr:DNA polymerase lambda [Mycena sanguinolenta]